MAYNLNIDTGLRNRVRGIVEDNVVNVASGNQWWIDEHVRLN